LRDYERAVDLGATDPFTYNNLAWLLITTGSANASRHAKRARKLAESALSMAIRSGMDGIELAHIYGTVAAAYAAEGDFDQAISNQVKALELYTKSDRTSIDAHSRLLIRYREGKVAPP
jgi:Flp pilus assembly protein TadD